MKIIPDVIGGISRKITEIRTERKRIAIRKDLVNNGTDPHAPQFEMLVTAEMYRRDGNMEAYRAKNRQIIEYVDSLDEFIPPL